MIRSSAVLSAAVLAASLVQPVGASDCACPREGHWKAQNHEGYMKCKGPIDFKRTLKPVKDKGTIWVLEEDCASVFGEASKKKDEDVLMERADDCGFEGIIKGEEEGVDMVIDVTWKLEGDEFIEGEMFSETTHMGMTCEYYRPYEIAFDAMIDPSDYAKLKKKMEKKLEKVRQRK